MDFGDILSKMTSKRIVVVGDVMLDRFIHGTVSRISPEAPVPVLSYQGEAVNPGGAANVALNLVRLGVQATVIGVTGNDENAVILADKLAEEPQIKFKAIADAKRPTTVKTRFSSSGQQILRVDHEQATPLPQAIYKRLLSAVKSALKDADMLILSDYNKGVIDHSTAQHIISLAKDAGVAVVADPKKTDASVYKGSHLITPNIHEFRAMTGLPLDNHRDIIAAGRDLSRRYRFKSILVTLGADGMMLINGKKDAHHIKSFAQSVFDVSGAGDTVIATVSAGMATGCDLLSAIEMANTAAGIVVGKSGTATTLAGEILAKSATSKPQSVSDVLGLVKLWRDAGLKVGFTNGCFDLLHPGHLFVLEKAALSCDRLIVGLNSDASTRRLKGEGRPHQDEDTRAAVLASLPAVDAVVIFDAPTPIKLIKSIIPDRLIKGGDYKADDVVGAETVRAHGGKVVIIPTKPGFSTTRLGS